MDIDDRTVRRLKLSDLRMLVTVGQCGSMSKAAARLNLTQSAVSKALGELEQALGVRLLDRTSQGVHPTHYGRALIDRSVAIFDELEQGIQDIRFLADPTAGEVRVGIGPPMADLLSDVVMRLARRHPKMTFRVVERDVTLLLQGDLRERTIDLVVGRVAPSPGDDELDVEVMFDDQIAVIAGLANAWTRRRKIKLQDLVQERWVLPPLAGLAGSHAADAFAANGLDVPKVCVFTNSIRVRDRLLATGHYLGMAAGVELTFRDPSTSLKILPVELNLKPRPLGVISLKGRTLGAAARIFLDELRALRNVRSTRRAT